MLKKILIICLFLIEPIKFFNGYHQTTKIEFEGINETCYGTLLANVTVVGALSTQIDNDTRAPENVTKAFKEYKDVDNYFYLNYLQDVSGGLLHWSYYPPEKFKVLLYFPDSDRFVVSDTINTRYALTSTYKATINNGYINLSRNYNYMKMIIITLFRVLIGIILALLMTLLVGRPLRNDYKYPFLTNIIFHIILNILISIYSFKNGFTIVEYITFIWIPYVLFFIYQGYKYKNEAGSIRVPFFCSFLSNLFVYIIFLLLVDFVPTLFTIA